MSGEKQLACAVIKVAIEDFLRKKDCRDECHKFLTGQTDIAKFWFQCAEVVPMSGNQQELLAQLMPHGKAVSTRTGETESE